MSKKELNNENDTAIENLNEHQKKLLKNKLIIYRLASLLIVTVIISILTGGFLVGAVVIAIIFVAIFDRYLVKHALKVIENTKS